MDETFIEPSRDMSDLNIYNLDYRRPLYQKGFPFVIFWSEKAACTVVAKWFFLQIGLLEEAYRHSWWIHDFEGKVFQRNKAEYLQTVLDALKSGVPAVKFVRDPYARAYSGFLELCRPHALTSPSNWSSLSRRIVVSELCSPATHIECTFSLRQYLLWRMTKKWNEIDGHLAEQYVPRDDCIRMRIVRVEEGGSAFRQLEQSFALPIDSRDRPDIFESGHHHKKSVEPSVDDAARMMELGVPLNRSPDFQFPPFNQDIALRAGLDELMRRAFPNDIAKYGYDVAPPVRPAAKGGQFDDAPMAANGHTELDLDAMMVSSRQLLAQCERLQSERDTIQERFRDQKDRLDRMLVQPSALTGWLVEHNALLLGGVLVRSEADRLRRLRFDEDYYLAHNPDVRARGLDPLTHFVRYGRREGRQFRLKDI